MQMIQRTVTSRNVTQNNSVAANGHNYMDKYVRTGTSAL